MNEERRVGEGIGKVLYGSNVRCRRLTSLFNNRYKDKEYTDPYYFHFYSVIPAHLDLPSCASSITSVTQWRPNMVSEYWISPPQHMLRGRVALSLSQAQPRLTQPPEAEDWGCWPQEDASLRIPPPPAASLTHSLSGSLSWYWPLTSIYTRHVSDV